MHESFNLFHFTVNDAMFQDPDVVTTPLPIEYGPVPEEEERVPVHPEDQKVPTLQVKAQVPDGEGPQPPSYPSEDTRRGGEQAGVQSTASEAKAQPIAQQQPCLLPHTQTTVTMTTTVTSTATATLTSKGPQVSTQPTADGGHVNLAFTQGHSAEKEHSAGKNTSLWNPTYGSWFLQQQQQRKQQQQQRQVGVGVQGGSGSRVPGEGQEHVGRTVAEMAGALGLQHQHKIQQQLHILHQQQGMCRPLLPPPPPPTVQSPLLLDSSALPPVPLYRLRRFPCGNIGYGYQEQGLPIDPASAQPSAAHPRGPIPTSLSRPGVSEDSRPLLVTMGTVQDPRLPRMEGHNATVL